jgi:hypothetical protein
VYVNCTILERPRLSAWKLSHRIIQMVIGIKYIINFFGVENYSNFVSKLNALCDK